MSGEGVCKKNLTFNYEGGTGPDAVKYISSLNNGEINVTRKLKCTWRQDADFTTCPHTRVLDWKKPEHVVDNILHTVGNTKLVKLNKIPQSYGLQCEVLVKCEFMNPGGSVKDRIALRMIEDAENQGILKPGSTIIEPTSGNTGVGLALAAAVKGYRCVIVMSEKMSNEKVSVLRALGAEIVRVPITEGTATPNGLFAVSSRLRKQIPNSIILDQYTNPGNSLAHYDTTAAEILDACDGKVDMVVAGAGTGGTVTGLGRKFKNVSPNTIVVAVDPYGSVMARPESLNATDKDFYEVEGLGYDFIPAVLDHSAVDHWLKTDDDEAFAMARRLIKEEGLLCGGSSGSAVVGAMKAAKNLGPGQRVVVILPDSIRNYLTKFVSDNWMETKSFKPVENTGNHWWWDYQVKDLPPKPIQTVTNDQSLKQVISTMKSLGLDQIPVLNKADGSLLGAAIISNILTKLVEGQLKETDSVDPAVSHIYPKVTSSDKLGLVSRILETNSYIIVCETKDKITTPIRMITSMDLLQFTLDKTMVNNGF